MCFTAWSTDFAPGRPVRTNSAACVGRRRATPNSTATKKPLAATSRSARMIFAAVTSVAYGTGRAAPAAGAPRSDAGFGGFGVRQRRGDVRRVAVAAGDELVAGLAVG